MLVKIKWHIFASLCIAMNTMFRAVKRDKLYVWMLAKKFNDAVKLTVYTGRVCYQANALAAN